MKFGNQLSNATMPVQEAYFQSAPQVVMTTNENFFAAGSYRMPFAGHLFCDMWAEVKWPGTSTLYGGAAVFLSVNASPAPSNTADLGVQSDCAGIFSYDGEIRTYAVWYNLGAGQDVYVNGRLWTNVVNQVRLNYLGGFFRPMAT